MQKKIIALAVAGLVSSAAFAQSNVTVYGIVDMGYQYSWDNTTSSTKSKSEIQGGNLDGSRFGFKGTEDLGNGLKANFDMTAGFGADTGVSYGDLGASKRLMSEGSSVGLEGNFGTVKAGYFGTFLDDNTGVDASGRHGPINTGSLYGTGKYENFVAYYSPSFSGLQVKAGFSSAVGQQDATPTATPNGAIANVRAYTTAVSYANGPISAGIAYAQYKGQTTTATNPVGPFAGNKAATDWNMGFKYDFGVAAASVFYAQQKAGDNAAIALGGFEKKKFWALGVAAPIGANDTIKAGYGQAKLSGNGLNGETGKAWNVVYLHSMSKRTTAYAMYGNLSSSDDAYLGAGAYQQVLTAGLRHTF